MAARPPLADVLGMARALGRGSPIEAPKSVFGVLRDTPADSPLTMRKLMRREDYRDLVTAKINRGQPAFDFELPQYDLRDGAGMPTGATVRLSDFRGVQPVALIFGSYT
jgi:hypothetical protein